MERAYPLTPTGTEAGQRVKPLPWTRKDWIIITKSGSMHLLKGRDHPLCRKKMPQGEIIHSRRELDDWDRKHPNLLEEICQNCQAIFVGFRP